MTGVAKNFVGQEGLAKLLPLQDLVSCTLHCKYSAIKGNLGFADGTLTAVED